MSLAREWEAVTAAPQAAVGVELGRVEHVTLCWDNDSVSQNSHTWLLAMDSPPHTMNQPSTICTQAPGARTSRGVTKVTVTYHRKTGGKKTFHASRLTVFFKYAHIYTEILFS